MGRLCPLVRPSRKVNPEIYPPANDVPPDLLRTMVFREDSNSYLERFHAVGVVYVQGEERKEDWHVLTTPDTTGPVLRWVAQRPNGALCVLRWPLDAVCRIYRRDEVTIHGAVRQFVKRWASDGQAGARWEYIEGPGDDGGGGESVYLRPFFTLSS
jgi:hypothetical protein